LSDLFQGTIARTRFVEFESMLMLAFTTGIHASWSSYLKRTFDVIVASLLVLILSPLFVLVVLLLKLFSPKGPIFTIPAAIRGRGAH
jgi:lipopolysaccharide/colanic/teichoic acid biosynthesis glycosyltransferase